MVILSIWTSGSLFLVPFLLFYFCRTIPMCYFLFYHIFYLFYFYLLEAYFFPNERLECNESVYDRMWGGTWRNRRMGNPYQVILCDLKNLFSIKHSCFHLHPCQCLLQEVGRSFSCVAQGPRWHTSFAKDTAKAHHISEMFFLLASLK